MRSQVVMVTGGAGFIGQAVVRHLLREEGARVVNVDALTYAANPGSLADVADDPGYAFEHADIRFAPEMARVLAAHRPCAIVHLAAESHVDRSIDDPIAFVSTNVLGTATLLEAARRHWRTLPGAEAERFRFLHVSTDEVFGSLGEEGAFDEDSPYRPSSPYAASKAGADHLVRAFVHTFGLPAMVSNCSNNFGPRQLPEKLIPLMIINALEGRPLPLYGRGANVRDWLFVEDHARALALILRRGRVGECYNVGGGNERRNIEVVEAICDLVDARAPPLSCGGSRRGLIRFVADRPGHDARYAVDPGKIARELGYRPLAGFDEALARTVDWYLANEASWGPLREAARLRRGLAGAGA
jgi:dTDP-glucose 4,6-dehydratase